MLHQQGERQYYFYGVEPSVMTSCACLPCSAAFGKIAAHQKKPIAGFPGSSNKQEGVLPAIKPVGRRLCPWPIKFAAHPVHQDLPFGPPDGCSDELKICACLSLGGCQTVQ